ncbi:hypothetical protein [Pseudomonas xanthosomatis]|uniref:hypothetical protein n=1 Tax=Pseudomonas xanthosomatis TaxID=2842356 RepID=UPI003510EB1A
MNTCTPKTGAKYKLDGLIYEVISINDDQISLCCSTNQQRRYLDHQTFSGLEIRGKLSLQERAQTDLSLSANYLALPIKKQEKYKRRLHYVKTCLEKLGGTMPVAATKKLIAEIASITGDNHPPKYSTLAFWRHIYLSSMRNPFCLLPSPSPQRAKRTEVTSEHWLKHYLDTVYLTLERPSLKHAYTLFKGHIQAENKLRMQQDLPSICTPSYSTFRRRALKIDRYHCACRRFGPKQAQRMNKFSGHLFSSSGPNDATQYDTQIMDVLVTQGNFRGRPSLSVHLSPSDRFCSGWDISLGAPCAEKMLRATIRAIVNQGKMSTIVADNGSEIANKLVQNFCSFVGIVIDYTPPGDPDAKAYIERFFNTVNSSFCHNLPGTTKSSPSDRGDYPSDERACMTIDDLREAFALWLDAYHDTWHEGILNSPRLKREKLRESYPPPEGMSEYDLKNLCLGVWRMRISGGRVKKLGLQWTGPGLPQISQNLKIGEKALVFYNPCNLGKVWVAHPDSPRDWLPAYAIRADYQEDLTLSDHVAIREQLRLEKRAFDSSIAVQKLYSLHLTIENTKLSRRRKPNKSTAHDNPRQLSKNITTFSLNNLINEFVPYTTFNLEVPNKIIAKD